MPHSSCEGGAPGSRSLFLDVSGLRLHVRLWPTAAPSASIVLLHGLESNSSWFSDLGDRLAAQGYLVAALDRAGSGLSSGTRGDVADPDLLADQLRALLCELDPRTPCFCLGFSWGARWALAHSISHPDDFAGTILMAPGFFLKAPYSIARQLFVATVAPFCPLLRFRTPTAADELFTTRREPLQFIRSDATRLSTVTIRLLWQSRRLARFIASRAGDLRTPLLHLTAGRDRICDNRRNREWLQRLPLAGRCTEVVYPDAEHALVFECRDCGIVQDIDEWVHAVLAGSVQ